MSTWSLSVSDPVSLPTPMVGPETAADDHVRAAVEDYDYTVAAMSCSNLGALSPSSRSAK
jgi:hypothetical protein